MPQRPQDRQFPVVDSLLKNPVLDLVRDPSLVPESRRGAYEALLAAVHRVRQELAPLRAMKGLTHQQRLEVAAIVLDADDGSRHHQLRTESSRVERLRRSAQRGPVVLRAVSRRLSKAKAAVSALLERSALLDDAIVDAFVPPVQQAKRYLEQAEGRLTARFSLAEYAARLRSIKIALAEDRRSAEAWRRGVAQSLVNYFRKTVSQTLDDAHVRSAVIGQARWGWRYQVAKNNYGKPHCPGIRQLLARGSSGKRARLTRRAAAAGTLRTPNKKRR